MSSCLTSKHRKEKSVNTHILALTHSYRLPPCSCCVCLGRKSGVLREGFMKEEACYGEQSQAEGRCEKRPGGNLGKLRAAEQASRDPHGLSGPPSTSLCSSDFHPQPSPAPGPSSVCALVHQRPLGPAPASPVAPVWCVHCPAGVPPVEPPVLLTLPLLQPSLPLTGLTLAASTSPAPCPVRRPLCAPAGSAASSSPFCPTAPAAPARAGMAHMRSCGPKGEWLLLSLLAPFPSTVPMSPKF